MSNLYTGALPLSAIRAAQAQRAAQDAPDKTAYTASAQDNGTAQNIKTLPHPGQERRLGTPTPPPSFPTNQFTSIRIFLLRH